jgi:hypothetical protein
MNCPAHRQTQSNPAHFVGHHHQQIFSREKAKRHLNWQIINWETKHWNM